MTKATDVKLTIAPGVAVLVAAYAALMIALFHAALGQMISGWNKDDYNYCYLIPFVVLYLLWERRGELFEGASTPSWWGLAALLAGIFFYWLGELGGEFYTLYVSSWLVLVGLCWLHLGWRKLKMIGFPLVLLITMFPFPNFIHTNLSLKLQLLSSQLGTAMIRLYGLPAYRDGNVIDLGFTQLQIVEACSGLRYLIPLIVIGIILVYFFRAPWWKRLLLLVSTVPWAIIVNAFRVALTGIFASIWGMGVVEGFSHDFAGWAVFMVSLAVLLGEMWVLGKLPPHPHLEPEKIVATADDCPPPCPPLERWAFLAARESEARGKEGAAPHQGAPPRQDPPARRISWLPQALVAVLILGSTLGLSYGIDFREKTPAKKPLTQFPLQVGDWRGKPLYMEQEILRALHLSDYVMIDYVAQGGRMVDFYVAYYESQRKGESTHTPATCLPGGGWVFEEAGLATFPTPGQNGGSTTVSRAFMTKANIRQLVYFWFPQRGRILHSLFELKYYAFWDALTRQRTDGALVRLITPLSPLEPAELADQRLQQFTREILPLLAEYIPGAEGG